MIKTQKSLVILIAVLLVFGVALSGCSEDGGDGGGSSELSGTKNYSGTWEGTSPQGAQISGTWQFEVDFDSGDVSGSFSGDASGDISGTVSDGTIDAQGDAAQGTVKWSGDFSDDGSQVSGTWEFINYEGSGTWEGTQD